VSWDHWRTPRQLEPFETARVQALRAAGCPDRYPDLLYRVRLGGDIRATSGSASQMQGSYRTIRKIGCKICGTEIGNYEGA